MNINNKIQLTNGGAVGSSFHNVYIKLNPADIFLFFGDVEETDGYKVSKEWIFEYKSRIFCLYDWKETNLYDSNLPSPAEYWAQDEVELHIASRHGMIEEMEFKVALKAHFFNKVGFLVLDA